MKIKVFVLAVVLMASSLMGQGISEAGGTPKASDQTLHSIGEKVGHAFKFEPFDPPMKNHLWMKTDEGKASFFHFAKVVSESGNKVLFIGDAIKGRFCAENQPEGGKTGYVHFHSATKADGHKHGHGGKAGQEGYWLRHIALGEFDMMGIHFTPGIAHNFKATPAPSCK